MENCSLCSDKFDYDELIEIKDGLLKMKAGFIKLHDVISDVFCLSKVSILSYFRDCIPMSLST